MSADFDVMSLGESDCLIHDIEVAEIKYGEKGGYAAWWSDVRCVKTTCDVCEMNGFH
jgi:hypothetical protein